MQAARLFAKGKASQAEIARELSVSRQSVMRWYRAWSQGGRGSLKAAGRAGRKTRLSDKQLQELERLLRRGPRAAGYRTDLWTLPRIAEVIERQWGVQYHPGHVWRIMRRLGWSLQRPTTQARERDEAAVQQWRKERWPQVKKTPDA